VRRTVRRARGPGGKVRLRNFVEVIGILDGKGQNTMGMDQDDIVSSRYIPSAAMPAIRT